MCVFSSSVMCHLLGSRPDSDQEITNNSWGDKEEKMQIVSTDHRPEQTIGPEADVPKVHLLERG